MSIIVNSEWIIDVKIKSKTIKISNKKQKNIFDLGSGNISQMTAPKAQFIKEYTDELKFIKINSLYPLKDVVKRMKRQDADWKIIYARHIFDKAFESGYIKNSQDSIIRKQRI